MIIVKLKGGIGNQLFQFAFGRAIAKHLNQELFFDLAYFAVDSYLLTPREFKLKKFKDYNIADDALNSQVLDFELQGKVLSMSDNMPDYLLIRVIDNPAIEAIILDGYFQAEFYSLYFKKAIKNEIRSLLAYYLVENLLKEIIAMKYDTVCIHVRRGDYLAINNLKIHGICGKSYYEEAIAIMKSKLNDPRFYIFSDDPELTNELLSDLVDDAINISSIINGQFSENQDLIELSLMTHCKHFIIANSSFSWWGSYLSESTSKIVIAPQKWYKMKVSVSYQIESV